MKLTKIILFAIAVSQIIYAPSSKTSATQKKTFTPEALVLLHRAFKEAARDYAAHSPNIMTCPQFDSPAKRTQQEHRFPQRPKLQ